MTNQTPELYGMRTIEQRTEFLKAYVYTKQEEEEIERIDEWVVYNQYTERPAQYIAWLEAVLAGQI